jgi:hypothetical protein
MLYLLAIKYPQQKNVATDPIIIKITYDIGNDVIFFYYYYIFKKNIDNRYILNPSFFYNYLILDRYFYEIQ